MIFFLKNHQKIKIILMLKPSRKGEKIHNSTKLSTFDKPYFTGFKAVFHNKNYSIYLLLSTLKIIILRQKKKQKIKKKSIFIIMQKTLSNKKGKPLKTLCHKGFMDFE